LSKSTNQPLILLIVSLLLCFSPVFAAPENNPVETGLRDYPRIEHFEQGSVTVDFPTIESWDSFRFLQAWLPVEVSLNGDSQARFGSVRLQAVTDIDFDQRTVRISGPSVLETRFADADSDGSLSELAARAFAGGERIVPLDVLLRLLPEDFQIPAQPGDGANLNFEPPTIVVSETPLQLLSIDKEPVKAQIEGTSLEFVINTNWSVFYNSGDERWYVLNDGTWQTNNYLSDGGWVNTDKLPADFDKLAANEEWQKLQKALPAKLPAEPPTPFMISLQATELIQLDGPPRLSAIESTGIHYVRNTQSDLFKFEGRWYFLVSGRWFRNDELSGSWQSVKDPPTAFAQIPSDHKMGHILFSVPGTRQAKLSLIEAAIPHRTLATKNSAANLKVGWVGEPRFVAIEMTKLQRGLNTPYQVISHNNFYYLCYEGAWYFSVSPEGPWQVALQIPDEIYRIPATDPAYNVTFVRLDEEQSASENEVNFSYSGGYTGSFSTTVSVVHGTGWHYPSSVYWDSSHRPAYWPYASTYGYNIGYHPVGAYYGGRVGFRGGWGGYGGLGGCGGWGGYGGRARYGVYGGYGGYGGCGGYTSITIESPTVDFNHGFGSAWEGPLQTTPGDPADAAERSLDQFLPAKKSTGNDKFIDTSKDEAVGKTVVSASSLYASSSLSSNMFSGSDGEVYKRENDEWQQYNDGSWSTAERRKRGYDLQNQPMRQEQPQRERFLPAHKKTLSRGELDRQELARIEGMDNYSKYRMEKDSNQ